MLGELSGSARKQSTRAPRPRRRPGSGNIYKRSDGRWEGRLRVDGKLYRVYARTERAAEHEVAALRAKIAGGRVSAPGSETVAEYLERWLATVGPSLAPRTMVFYRQLVRDHIVPVVGRVRLDRLDPSDVQGMIAVASHRGLSAATIQRIRATLRAALSMAMRWAWSSGMWPSSSRYPLPVEWRSNRSLRTSYQASSTLYRKTFSARST